MICPKCNAKFLEDAKSCLLCKVDLVNELPEINTIGEINPINQVNKIIDSNDNKEISLENNIMEDEKNNSDNKLQEGLNSYDNITENQEMNHGNDINENMKNTINVVDDSKTNNDYYTSTGRKVGDFFIGLGISIVLQIIPIIGSLASIALGIYFISKKTRRFIGIGMISQVAISIVLVLLLFGACLISIPF